MFNLQSPDASHAMNRVLKVRQAIAYTINKSAIQKLYGGHSVAQIISTAIPPGNLGYPKPINPFPSPGNPQGDPSKCKAGLLEGRASRTA